MNKSVECRAAQLKGPWGVAVQGVAEPTYFPASHPTSSQGGSTDPLGFNGAQFEKHLRLNMQQHRLKEGQTKMEKHQNAWNVKAQFGWFYYTKPTRVKKFQDYFSPFIVLIELVHWFSLNSIYLLSGQLFSLKPYNIFIIDSEDISQKMDCLN